MKIKNFILLSGLFSVLLIGISPVIKAIWDFYFPVYKMDSHVSLIILYLGCLSFSLIRDE